MKSEKPPPSEESLVCGWFNTGGNSALTKVKWEPDLHRTWLVTLVSQQTSVLLVCLPRLAFWEPQVVPHFCVHEGPNEDKQSAQPVPQSERVLEVQDGKDEAHKLA